MERCEESQQIIASFVLCFNLLNKLYPFVIFAITINHNNGLSIERKVLMPKRVEKNNGHPVEITNKWVDKLCGFSSLNNELSFCPKNMTGYIKRD